MFGRGNWAVFGLEPTSQDDFLKSINDASVLFGVSQLGASARTKMDLQPSFGINGYLDPRQDDEVIAKLGPSAHQLLVDIFDHISKTPEQQVEEPFDYSRVEGFYGDQPGAFRIGPDFYGFWMVFNTFEDIDDMASKREGISYKVIEKPYKFLVKEDKKAVEAQVKTKTVLRRKQFPVLLDFRRGRGYALSTSVDEVTTVRDMLTELGAVSYSVVWRFGNFISWPTEFLNKVYTNSKFKAEFQARADELARFDKEEVEPLEDLLTERIVTNFFAAAELETSHWACLKPAAKIKLHKTSEPIAVADPSTAFSVMQISTDTKVVGAAVVIQTLDSYFLKGGKEKVRRTDIVTMDVNDNVNLLDAGAALLRGFDIPMFRGHIKQMAKAGATPTITGFWEEWLLAMRGAIAQFTDDVATTLDISLKTAECGIQPFAVTTKATVTVNDAAPAAPQLVG